MKKVYLLALLSAISIGSLLSFSAPAQAQEEGAMDETSVAEEMTDMPAETETMDTYTENMAADMGGNPTLETTAMETPVSMNAGYMGGLGIHPGKCVIQGAKTCPKITMVPKTVCHQVPVPMTVYRSRPFHGRTSCPNCVVQGTQTCPETQITHKTVCRQIMTPKLVYVTRPFHASTCSPNPCY